MNLLESLSTSLSQHNKINRIYVKSNSNKEEYFLDDDTVIELIHAKLSLRRLIEAWVKLLFISSMIADISLAGAYRANVMRVLTHQFPNLRRHCIFANRARGRSQNRPQMLQSGAACCFAIHTTVLVVRGRVSRAKCEHAGWALFSICSRNPLIGGDPVIPCHLIIKIPG